MYIHYTVYWVGQWVLTNFNFEVYLSNIKNKSYFISLKDYQQKSSLLKITLLWSSSFYMQSAIHLRILLIIL